MSVYEEMHSGELYLPNDEELAKEQMVCLDRLYDFNQTRPTEWKKREEMLKEMFAEIGKGCYIEPPFHANWGGRHVHFGKSVYANFNLTMVDDTHIGRNCWIGAGVIIVPGITIEDNTVIGAGSVVTKDIPANSVAVGNPCRVIREINEKDKQYYYKDRKIVEK